MPRPSFELYKSHICHLVKDMGDFRFIASVLKDNDIFSLWDKERYAESLYLLAMVDYLSRENNIPICTDFERIRCAKLTELLYPAGILIMCAATNSDEYKKEALREAIPEFLRHNIVEAEVRDVC